MVGGLGIEPSMPEATDLQSAEVTNASHRPRSNQSNKIMYSFGKNSRNQLKPARRPA